MSTAANVTVTQVNPIGNVTAPIPPVQVTKVTTGGMPSGREAARQREAQAELNATVVDAGAGKGDSRSETAQKNPAPKKVEAKAEEKKEAREGNGGQQAANAAATDEVEKAKQANGAVERARRRSEELKEAKARLKEIEESLPKLKELEEAFKEAHKDPIGFLKKAGLDVSHVAEAALNGGKRTEEAIRLEELEKAVKERDKRETEERKLAETRAKVETENQGIAAHFSDVNRAITSDGDAYEFCNLKMQGEKVPLKVENGSTFMVEPAIADAYSIQEHAMETLGRVLQPKELADALEKYYTDEYAQLKSSKKVRELLGLAGDREAKGSTDASLKKAPPKKEAPTLGSRRMSEASAPPPPVKKLSRKDFRSEAEFVNALAKQGEERLRLLRETR